MLARKWAGMVPRPGNALGIKWEFGDGDPIRGQMPKPPPRL